MDGQNHANCRAFPWFTFRLDAAAMQLRDVFDDCEAETGTGAIGAPRFVRAIKPFENARQILFADPDTIVADAQYDFAIALFNP